MAEIFKLVTDELRIRILLLLDKKELSVCQLMGITGASQPLVSRNLSLLYKGGFLEERREGKMRFYRIKENLPEALSDTLDLLLAHAGGSDQFNEDLKTLEECTEFQKKAGKCDMKTLQEFIEWKKRRRNNV